MFTVAQRELRPALPQKVALFQKPARLFQKGGWEDFDLRAD